MKGVGIHVFAGGFTRGVRSVLPVVGQLEIHNFGRETVEGMGLPFMNADTWEGWDNYKSTWEDCRFCYGNPRCTSFSSFSSGCSTEIRGPRAKPTRDIWDLVSFGVDKKLDLIAFESVQQAYTVGRPLINRLVHDVFKPKHYRVAHLFVNTAAEGNAQRRRRYFFVAYRNDRNFNVTLPELPKRATTVGDVLAHPKFKRMKTFEGPVYGEKSRDVKIGCHSDLSDDERIVMPYLQHGESLNGLAHRDPSAIKRSAKLWKVWKRHSSGIPFSLHCMTRLHPDRHCPTIASTSGRLIHPFKDRTLTVGEIAALMGWPIGDLPKGRDPIAQIGKGVVPATGAWLALQIKLYFKNAWGDEDFESRYDKKSDTLYGTNTNGQVEKRFQLTAYEPELERR